MSMDTTCLSPQPAASLATRILATAHRLFYRDGIRATGIDRIISESGVAKKTFYRYYAAKDDLVIAFLECQHRDWITWFQDSLVRHGADVHAIVPAFAEWFAGEAYRGCALINAIVEIGGTLPAAVDISRRHQFEMAGVLDKLLPESDSAKDDAHALAVAIDGAIICAQRDGFPDAALKSLSHIVTAVSGQSTDRRLMRPICAEHLE